MTATTRVHDVLEEYFVKGTYQHYDGETSGDPLSDVVTEILGEDAEERVVPAILEVLTDNFNGDPSDGDEPYWDDTENYEIRSGWNIDEYADDAWEHFRRGVKSEYRFFNDDARDFLAKLFQDVDKLRTWQRHSKGKPTVIYELTDQSIFRGRQVTSLEQLRQFAANPARELHAPPPSVAKAGRMNPEGVRFSMDPSNVRPVSPNSGLRSVYRSVLSNFEPSGRCVFSTSRSSRNPTGWR